MKMVNDDFIGTVEIANWDAPLKVIQLGEEMAPGSVVDGLFLTNIGRVFTDKSKPFEIEEYVVGMPIDAIIKCISKEDLSRYGFTEIRRNTWVCVRNEYWM